MIPVITEKLDGIHELCRQFKVRQLILFGSAVDGSFIPEQSDIDLLVEFDSIQESLAVVFFDFKNALENLLHHKIDLILIGTIKNPYILTTVHNAQELLYAA